jgi:hypothetical protein
VADLDLPQSVLDLTEFTPMEDVALYILRAALPDVPCFSLIPDDPPRGAWLLVRRESAFGEWRGNSRFLDFGRVAIQAFTEDPDGDEKAALLSEAVRVCMREARLANLEIPGVGWVTRIEMLAEPVRKTDWATSQGPVQFADLPNGYWRYEARYALYVRKRLNP